MEYGGWKKSKPIFHQFATALRLLQKGSEFSRRVAWTSIYPGSKAVSAFRRTFNVTADQSCVNEDNSTSHNIFSIHLHACIHIPNSRNLDLVLKKCLRILRGLTCDHLNFTSWLNLTKQWGCNLIKRESRMTQLEGFCTLFFVFLCRASGSTPAYSPPDSSYAATLHALTTVRPETPAISPHKTCSSAVSSAYQGGILTPTINGKIWKEKEK